MTKKKLPVLGKSLMPEVLPDPRRAKGGDGSSARARVRSRLQQIKDNAAAVAAAAAIAACGDSGNRYNVVDELPSPAGRGAGGSPWPNAGYGVVDPLPDPAGRGGAGYSGQGVPPTPDAGPPAMCTTLDPLDPKTAKAQWRSPNSLLFSIGLMPGVSPTAVKLTQVISNAMNATDVTGNALQPFLVVLDSNPWPEHTYIKLSVFCGAGAGPQLVTETSTFDIDTSQPAAAGNVPVTLRVADESDAGTP
jgi:hypothetical protein